MIIRQENPKQDYNFYNPSDTREILFQVISKKSDWEFNRRRNRDEKKDWRYEHEPHSDFTINPSLIFGKFIPYTLWRNEDKENKGKYLELFVSEFENFKSNSNNFLNSLKERSNKLFENLENYGYVVEKIFATCSWRLIIGLGATHPQETSMTLHHIYGIPYIPASALKGVTRHYAITKFAEEKCKESNESFDDAIKRISDTLDKGKELNTENQNDKEEFAKIVEIFGTQQQEGKVIFMDAYPDSDIKLKIDVMSPHYPKYYSGDAPPSDWQNPNPIKFLTVENTKFQFCLAGKSQDLTEKAKELLEESLKNIGIGAKTAVGYGYFKI